MPMQTLKELLAGEIAGREIYRYTLRPPYTLDDPAVIEILVVYGSAKEYPEGTTTERYVIKLHPTEKETVLG